MTVKHGAEHGAKQVLPCSRVGLSISILVVLDAERPHVRSLRGAWERVAVSLAFRNYNPGSLPALLSRASDTNASAAATPNSRPRNVSITS